MVMDPVKLALEEILSIEQTLEEARSAASKNRRRAEAISILEIWLGELRASLADMEPTSAVGAAELIKMARCSLPPNLAYLSPHLGAVAGRLSEGDRRQGDIIWLRAVLQTALCAPEAASVKRILERALAGAARPVLIYRAANRLATDDATDLAI